MGHVGINGQKKGDGKKSPSYAAAVSATTTSLAKYISPVNT
jgi:hypothetical protein